MPNIIFIFSVLGILLLILRRLPQATAQMENQGVEAPAHHALQEKGLPAQALSKVRVFFNFWTRKTWNFILEAKDLKPHAAAGYKMKKIFGGKLPTFSKPAASITIPVQSSAQAFNPPQQAQPQYKTEKYYLEIIKAEPKALSNYDALGKFYLDNENYEDARDIYLYLASHEPASPDYQARLAYCHYQTGEYRKAAERYKKSLALDSTQPNRYYNLALSLEASGNLEECVKIFEQAIQLEPAVKYYVSLSNAYLKMGNAEKAKKALLTAKKAEPYNETVRAKLQRFVKA